MSSMKGVVGILHHVAAEKEMGHTSRDCPAPGNPPDTEGRRKISMYPMSSRGWWIRFDFCRVAEMYTRGKKAKFDIPGGGHDGDPPLPRLGV
jgi:hypothetical protein